MDNRSEAEKLAKRPYIIMTSVDSTTNGHPVIFARVLEIDGCFGQGETRETAIKDLRLAMVDYIESLLDDELPVPEPTKLSAPLTAATQGAFTFVREGKKLQPKTREAYQDVYTLSAHGN